MQDLADQRVIVTGGSRGLGLGIVEALVERNAQVTVLARDAARLAALQERLGVSVISGDITDPALAKRLLRDVRPTVLVLNAGTQLEMAPLHELTWESFSAAWDVDVKAGLHWMQEAIRMPLDRGSRVLVGSSGAALTGSPLSGGYAGAKRMLWLMAQYANIASDRLDLGIRFQALLPLQIIGETDFGRNAAVPYAHWKGTTLKAFFAAFGKPMSPRQYGEYVATLLTDPAYAAGTAFGFKGDTGITSLDAVSA